MMEMKEKMERSRHGGPYDRGAADSYYGRPGKPHYYDGPSLMSKKICKEDMTEEEIKEYWNGYDDNEENDLKKDWGYDR
tara:strand:+ start:395 stop:631 length:237 start_codon:yes stop_codon:yes gene_type:complete